MKMLKIENRIYRAASMRKRYDFSDATLWRYIKSGKIPQP
jgi:predicted DNA-binding transcriptional regulator AlpA